MHHIPDLRELRSGQLPGDQEPDITRGSGRALAAGLQGLPCPGCGYVPNGKIAAARLREELMTAWWSTTGTGPDRVQVTNTAAGASRTPSTPWPVWRAATGRS